MRMNAARREVLYAYETVRQVGGDGTIVQRVAKFLGRPLNQNKDNTYIRKVIKEHQEERSTK